MHCYVKREDELGFGISGSKIRKYLALVPYILSQKPDEVILIGTPYSNHILGLSQLLRENGIPPTLFLAGGKEKPTGNYLLTSLFAERIELFEKGSWNELEKHVEEYIDHHPHKKIMVIPKGGNTKEALYGLLTLPLDILKNEKELGLTFDHIIMDSGTGFTAAAVILGLTHLGRKPHVHVFQMAGSVQEFHDTFAFARGEFEQFIGEKQPSPLPYSVYLPTNAKSFGSVNATVLKTIKEIAKAEGFLVDPIYNAKLFYEGQKLVPTLKGNILFIHSGGGISLLGFLP